MENKKSVADENREYWNTETNFYEKEKDWANKIADQYTKELHCRREWLGLPENKDSSLRLLDVACGPGMMSHALFDFVGEARGIDIADRMVETYNSKAQEKGLSQSQMSAVQGNIVAVDASSEANISGPEYFECDIVTMANALHHMEDPALTIERLMQRLKPGGTLLIVELIDDKDNHDVAEALAKVSQSHHHSHGHHSHGHDHGHGHAHEQGHGNQNKYGVAHFGFTKEQLEKYFADAGCIEVSTVLLDEPIKFPPALGSMERTACFAKGKKDKASPS